MLGPSRRLRMQPSAHLRAYAWSEHRAASVRKHRRRDVRHRYGLPARDGLSLGAFRAGGRLARLWLRGSYGAVRQLLARPLPEQRRGVLLTVWCVYPRPGLPRCRGVTRTPLQTNRRANSRRSLRFPLSHLHRQHAHGSDRPVVDGARREQTHETRSSRGGRLGVERLPVVAVLAIVVGDNVLEMMRLLQFPVGAPARRSISSKSLSERSFCRCARRDTFRRITSATRSGSETRASL